MEGIGLIVLFAALAGLIWWAGQTIKRKRVEALTRVAAGLGFEFSRGDPFDTLSLPFPLFGRGDGRGTENAMWGEADGAPFRMFDYWYYEDSTDAKGNRSRTYHRFTCALTEIDADCPHVSISRETLLTRLADAVGLRDIDFESEEFNRRFQVKASDRQGAFAIVDAPMMEWLLANGSKCSYDVHGHLVLAASGKAAPAEWPELGTALRAFREQIPRAVASMYPRGRA